MPSLVPQFERQACRKTVPAWNRTKKSMSGFSLQRNRYEETDNSLKTSIMLRILIKLLPSLLFLNSLILPILSSPVRTRSGYSVKNKHAVPDNWVCIGRAPPGHKIRLQVGLRQHRFDELERHLYEGELLQSLLPLQPSNDTGLWLISCTSLGPFALSLRPAPYCC